MGNVGDVRNTHQRQNVHDHYILTYEHDNN